MASTVQAVHGVRDEGFQQMQVQQLLLAKPHFDVATSLKLVLQQAM